MAKYLPLPNGDSLKVPDDMTYEEAVAKAKTRFPELFKEAAAPAPKARFSGGDTLRSVGQGALGGIKALTDVFGAGNAASNILEAGTQRLQEGMTAGRKAELAAQAQRMKEAEASGDVKKEASAALENFFEAPIQATAQGVGSLIPFAATSVAGTAAKLLPATIRTIQTVMGAGMGAGSVKGSIYDAVYQQNIKDGRTPEEAHQQAQAAQEYVGKNAEQIGVGTVLGAAAARTGAEKLLTPGAERGLAAGVAKRVGKAVAEEVPMEAAQGGQERLAANVALQREGVNVPTFQGVAGQAIQEGLTAGLAAGPLAAYRSPRAGLEAQRRAEEQRVIDERVRAQEEADAARRSAPDYIPNLLKQSEAFTQQETALKEAIKAGEAKGADPVAKAAAAKARADLNELRNSQAYKDHKDEMVQSVAQVQALQAQRAQEAEAAAKAEADAKEARLNDPAVQGPLYAEFDRLNTEKQAANERSKQALRNGDMAAARKEADYVAQLQQQMEQVQGQLGKRPEAPAPTKTPVELQDELVRLLGGVLSNGKKIRGSFDTTTDPEIKEQLFQRVEQIHAELKQHDAAQKAEQAAMWPTDLGTEDSTPWQAAEPTRNEPGQTPTGEAAVDTALESAFGKDTSFTQGDMRTGERAGPLGRVATPQQPSTVDLQQESMFPDMEQGGNAGTPIENLQAQIDLLRNRPNMPASTLAQLENYQRVLENPALADPENRTAQNALEVIKENVDRIAYQGAGQGVERAMSPRELQAKIAEVRQRRVQMGKSVEAAQVDVRRTVPNTPEEAARMAELRALRQQEAALATELDRLQGQLQTANTSYPVRPTKFVALDANGNEVVDATEEQIARARRGDKRGREVGAVNVEPSTITEQTPLTFPGMEGEVGTRTEERPGFMPPTATGSAKITRISERTIGVDRAGPSDAELNDNLRALSPADERTLNLWDPVFGAGSPAARMVSNAETGLQKALQAVSEAEKTVTFATYQLGQQQKLLAQAQSKDPFSNQLKLAEGNELAAQRAVDRAQEKVAAADARAEADRNLLTQQLARDLQAQQKIIDEAKRTQLEAQRQLRLAQAKFNAEFARLQRTGELTPDLVKFVGTRSMKDDLAKAQADIAELGSGDGEFAGLSRAMFAKLQKSASSINTALQAQEMIEQFVPKIRKQLGARAAQLADTVLRLQAARNIVGVGMELKQAVDVAQREAAAIDKDMQARIKRATTEQGRTLKAANKRLGDMNARAEIARIELQAARDKLQALQDALETMRSERAEREGAPVQEARKGVREAEKALTEGSTQLSELRRTQNERITEARENLQRAKDTQQALFENEQALREGRTMPLLAAIKATTDRINGMNAEQEAEALAALESKEVDAADVAADRKTVEDQMADLDRVEAELTKLLQKHVSDFTEVQDEVATLLDTSTLLESDVYDADRENAQRIVDRAGVRAQVNALAEEEARTMTQRDAVINNILKLLDENADQLSQTPDPRYYAGAPIEVNRYDLLQQQRARLYKQYSEKAAFFTDRLQRLRDKKASLEPELYTAPDPALKDWGKTQIETLRGLQERMRSEINGLRARIESLRKARSAALGTARAKGQASLQQLRDLGLSDRQAQLPKLMDELVASLKHQHVETVKADKRVQDAYKKMRAARSEVFAFDPYAGSRVELLDLKEKARIAQDAYRAAALDRAKLHDDLVSLERMQLSIAQEIASIKPQREALPVPKAKTQTQESAQVTSEQVSPERWKSMTSALERGAVKGPEVEQESPEIAEFRNRINSTDNVRGLRKELGSLQAEYANLIEEYESTPAGKTLTRDNAAVVRVVGGQKVGNRAWARAALEGTKDGRMREQSLALFDKMQIIRDRIDAIREERMPSGTTSAERLASTQTTRRMGPVTKKVTTARDWRMGVPETTEAVATGTRNRPTERALEPKVTATQVVRKANQETGAQMALRLQMEQAKLERDLDAARKARSEAKERYDAVMSAPRASDNAKEIARTALDAAEAAVKQADTALKENTKTAVFRTAPASGPALKKQRIVDITHDIVSSWKNVPSIRVVQSISDLPQRIQDQATADGRTDIPGLFDPETETVYLVADGLSSAEDVVLTIAHEISGHYGLRDMLGTGYTKMMNDIYDSVAEVKSAADARMKSTPSLSREVAVEEVLAERAEVQPGRSGVGAALSRLYYAIKAALRNILGRAGFKPDMLRITDAEVGQIVANARRHVKRGKPGPNGGVRAASEQAAATQAKAPVVYRTPKYDTTTKLGQLASEITAAPVSPMERFSKNLGLAAEMWGVDMRAPLMKALSVAGDKTLTQAAYYVRKADALMNHVYAALGSGPLKLEKDAKGFFSVKAGNGPGMQAILEAVNNVKGISVEDKMAKAQAYLVAQRAERVGWDKLNFDPAIANKMRDAADEMRRELAADPEQRKALESVRNVYNAYNKGMVEFLAESGYLSKAKAAELLRHGDYVPFYRVGSDGAAEFVMGEGAVIHIGDLRNNKFLAPLVGDDQKLLPLNEAMIRNTMLITELGMKNLAQKDVAYALQKIGAKRGPGGRNIMNITSQKLTGTDVIHFRQEPDPNDPKDTGERYLQVRTQGTGVDDIPAEMLVQSLEGGFSTLPAGLRAAAWFGDILRAGVTRNPMYIARQLIRDPMAATFTGGLESGITKSVFKSLGNFAEQMAGRSKEGEELLQRGLIHSGIFTGDADDIKKMALQLADGNQGAFKKTLAWWDKAAMNADAATRIQLFKDAKAKGMSDVEAEFAAMEMMNFNKRGLSPTVQYAARMIPFLNAQIQGMNVLVKAMTGNMPQNEKLQIREKFYRRAMTMALFTMAYAMAMDDDDTYENARPRDKYSNWFLPNPLGEEHIKIPIPFEVGLLFKAVPEALVDMMKGDFNDQEFKAIRQMFTQQIPGAGSYGLPQAMKPMIEVVTNHSFFTGREIESRADAGKVSQERFGPGTTEIAKEMSKVLNAAGMELSPKQIDHLIGGYLGSLPVIVARLTNNLFDTVEGPIRPAERASDNPVFGSLFQRNIGGGFVDAAYAQQEALEKAKKSYDDMVKQGRKVDAQEFKEDVLNVLGSPELANRWKAAVTALRTQENNARLRIKDPEALRAALDAIERKRNEAAKMYVTAVQQIAR